MDEVRQQFISLSEAAKILGTSRDYVNVLIRRGKIKATKIGRNWLTTSQWLTEYQREKNPADELSETDDGHLRLRMEQMRLDQEFALASLEHERQLRILDNQKEIRFKEIERGFLNEFESPRLETLEQEKKQVADFFTTQLEEIKAQLEQERESKQALVEEITRLKLQLKENLTVHVGELVRDWEQKEDLAQQIEFLKENFGQAITAAREDSEASIQEKISYLTEDINSKLQESKIVDAVERLKDRFEKNIQVFTEEEPAPQLMPVLNFLPVEPSWEIDAIHPEKIHFLAQRRQPTRLQPLAAAAAAGSLLLVAVAGLWLSYPHAGKALTEQIARPGTEYLVFARAGQTAAETILKIPKVAAAVPLPSIRLGTETRQALERARKSLSATLSNLVISFQNPGNVAGARAP